MEFEERKRSSRDARTNSKSKKIVLALLCAVDQKKRSKNEKKEICLKICEDMWKERERERNLDDA